MAVIRVGSSSVAAGTSGRDTIYGDARGNTLYGFGGDDRLYGRGGDDDLFGHNGRDTLTGGSGYDNFYFTTRPTKASVDVITDYSKKFDTIVLSQDIFKGLGRAGAWMNSSAFWQ